MKKILVFSNHPSWTYNLRGEILDGLIKEGYTVIVAVGYGKEIDWLKGIGCEWIDVPFNRHGKNPFKEILLYKRYRKLLDSVHPDVVLSYTIKPNLYAGFLCSKRKTPCIANITGLGTAVEYPGILRSILLRIYKRAFKGIYKVFFQNTMNRDLFIHEGIVNSNYDLLPGSGVNISRFKLLPYPEETTIEFIFVSRIMKEKGIDEYLDAAIHFRKVKPNTRFHICGFCEQKYEEKIAELEKQGIVISHGMVSDMPKILEKVHCLVLPTYYPEGMSNVLLESCASGRPIITTNRPGCGEIVEDGINGYVVRPQDSSDLISKMEKFIQLSHQEKIIMGLSGRKKIEKEFDRQIVVNKYLEAVKAACMTKKGL